MRLESVGEAPAVEPKVRLRRKGRIGRCPASPGDVGLWLAKDLTYVFFAELGKLYFAFSLIVERLVASR